MAGGRAVTPKVASAWALQALPVPPHLRAVAVAGGVLVRAVLVAAAAAAASEGSWKGARLIRGGSILTRARRG